MIRYYCDTCHQTLLGSDIPFAEGFLSYTKRNSLPPLNTEKGHLCRDCLLNYLIKQKEEIEFRKKARAQREYDCPPGGLPAQDQPPSEDAQNCAKLPETPPPPFNLRARPQNPASTQPPLTSTDA